MQDYLEAWFSDLMRRSAAGEKLSQDDAHRLRTFQAQRAKEWHRQAESRVFRSMALLKWMMGLNIALGLTIFAMLIDHDLEHFAARYVLPAILVAAVAILS